MIKRQIKLLYGQLRFYVIFHFNVRKNPEIEYNIKVISNAMNIKNTKRDEIISSTKEFNTIFLYIVIV